MYALQRVAKRRPVSFEQNRSVGLDHIVRPDPDDVVVESAVMQDLKDQAQGLAHPRRRVFANWCRDTRRLDRLADPVVDQSSNPSGCGVSGPTGLRCRTMEGGSACAR